MALKCPVTLHPQRQRWVLLKGSDYPEFILDFGFRVYRVIGFIGFIGFRFGVLV